MNNADKQYLNLLEKVMEQPERSDRTGTGTRSLFGYQMRFHNLENEFPLLTTKRVYWKGVVHELLWMLRGETNIKPLVDNNVSIWTAWPHKNYVKVTGNDISIEEYENRIRTDAEFAAEHGDIGPCYGYQWRKWLAGYCYENELFPSKEFRSTGESSGSDDHFGCDIRGSFCWTDSLEKKEIDQVKNSIDSLRSNPNNRRNLISAWNVADLAEMEVAGLPPCHCFVQFYTRKLTPTERISRLPEYRGTTTYGEFLQGDLDAEKVLLDLAKGQGIPEYYLDSQVYIRSNDLLLGAPFNIAQYALMNHLFASCVNMIPGELVYTIGDAHIYSNHYDQVKEQLSRDIAEKSPQVTIEKYDENYLYPWELTAENIKLHNYNPQASIKAEVAV